LLYTATLKLAEITESVNNAIISYILNPYDGEGRNGQTCEESFMGNRQCVDVLGNEYVSAYNKITIFERDYDSIEGAIRELLDKEGYNVDNCQIKIKDYEYGKQVILSLSDEQSVSEQEIADWEEVNGPADGAYSPENFVSVKKTKELCSKYTQPQYPSTKRFIFDESRRDIFAFYEDMWTQDGVYFYLDSFQFLK